MVELGQTVWITKYALSRGVLKGAVSRHGGFSMIWLEGDQWSTFLASEYFTTEQAAREDVLRRIAAKRKAIAKQLEKLDKLERKMLAEVKA